MTPSLRACIDLAEASSSVRAPMSNSSQLPVIPSLWDLKPLASVAVSSCVHTYTHTHTPHT